MPRILVAGSGTEVGKTVVSAILTTMLQADYWKPIQCGDEEHSDTRMMKKWIDTKKHRIHQPSYSFKNPLSPHHAAKLENRVIDYETIQPPLTRRLLIIEGVGGIFVPLTNKILTLDIFKSWNCQWVIVSKHYLGSINHTLLTIDALKKQQLPLLGLVFNGEPNPESERAILEISQLSLLGRLLPEQHLNQQIIKRYATSWDPCFYQKLL
jgi:dethiobiotin synthetase